MAKKSTPSVAYFEEADDDGHLIPGAEPKYARSTAPSSPSKEKPNTGRSRKDSSRRERSPSPSFSESDSTEPPHVPKRDPRTNKMKGDKKRDPLVKQQRPPARSHKTAPSAPSRISDESSYYGIHPQQNIAASRPRARTRPESYYGQRPPLSTSAYAHQPPMPPSSASVITPPFPPPWMGGPPPPPMAMAHALVHQPIPSPTYSEMNPPSRDLASRFRRPQSAIGFQPPLPPPDYEPVKEKALTRRTSVSRKVSRNHDERDRIPPPSRPASTQPPRERLVFRPTPTHTVTRRKSVGFEDDDLGDADPAMYKAVARREVEYGSGALPSLPRHRRQSFDAESVFDVDTSYDLETASRGRRNSFYNFEDKIRDASRYQEDVSGGGGPPLTAEALRRVKNDGSSRSTRSSASRDESDYKQSATTRTTRSNSGDDDITIKLPIGAVIEVGNTKIHCKDGGDINIGRGNGTSRAGGSDPPASTYGDDRKSRADRSVARTRASSQAGSYSRTRHAPPLYAPPSSYHYDDYYGPQYSAPYLAYHHDDDDDSEYSS
ncbi:hypothetical protein F4811DRAFT_346214 [Daldinia bambusicola]|nr:hypothetical protein F4811DRAFT_346214 [Daldinia bambusicola]